MRVLEMFARVPEREAMFAVFATVCPERVFTVVERV
jgi:hypothetical protein